MATKIQLRRDTAADWTSNNPTLAAGEFGWESDTNRFKIGDGATAWTSLDYASDGDTAGITFVGDDSTGTLVSQNETFKIAGGTGITTAVSGDTLTVTNTGTGTITALNNQAENRLTTIGATTTELDGEANLTFDGTTLAVTGNITATTSIANDAISIDDNKITTTRSNDKLIFDTAGTGPIDFSNNFLINVSDPFAAQDVATKNYVDTQDAAIASDTLTLTNKTFDANGTGNSISNIETADIAASTLVTAAEGIGSNDNDTTIPTSAAVKAYADSVGGGGGASTGDITFTGSTIQSPSNANLTLDPSGTGTIELTADTNVTGGLTATTSIANDAISIDDNVIKTTRSNDNLLMTANGTGYIVLGDTAANQAINVDVNERYGVIKVHRETVSASTMSSFNDHRRANTTKSLYTLSSGSTSGDAIFQQNLAYTLLDLNGYSLTGSYTPDFGSGASNKISTTLTNNGASASTLAEAHGMFNQVDHFSFGGSTLAVTNTVGNGVYINAYPNTTVTNAYGVRTYANTVDFGGGPGTITNFYGFYIHDTGNNPTNQYGFWDTTNSLSRFGAVRLDNQASDPSGVADASHIYAKDVSSSSEVFVRDEAGNVTQISPHNEQGEWQYYSVNEKTGKTVRVNMEQMIRKLEEITGETFIENE